LVDQQFPVGDEGAEVLGKIVEKIKKHGKGKEYDCIVGISGGIDSTYVLYKAIKLGLRPLAVLFDNGWNSEIAVTNIKNAVSKLNVDLETFVVDWEEFKSLLVSFLKASVPDADAPTDIGIKATLYRKAEKYKIKYIISGVNFRTEGYMPRKWSFMDGRYIRSVHKIFSNKKLENFPNLTMLNYLNYIFIRKIEVVRILNYIDYPKAEIKEFLQKEVGWQDYGGKHYESIFTRFNQNCIRYNKFGFDVRLIEYSALVRSGLMSREDAFSEVKKPPLEEEKVNADIKYIIKKLELTEEEFDEIYNSPAKSFLDYPTYFPFINSIKPIVNFVSKFVKRV